MDDIFLTIKAISEGIYKEKGSKFIAFAIPVTHVDEIKELMQHYKKEYYDARHICYAYRLGVEKKDYRYNDDSEPSGTAGKPILGQILSNDLTNILILVVRYFGGVKLGTSGLISAYKNAAADAISNGEIIEKTVDMVFDIHFQYPFITNVMRILKEENVIITEQIFDNECFVNFIIRQSNAENVQNRLKKVENLKIESL
jgi:uncharacterized YigZ family protein